MTDEPNGIRAKAKESIVSDTCDDLKRIAAKNVTTHRELHSLVGKLNHAAGVLIIMRPFLEPLWAALYDTRSTKAPSGIVWSKQIWTSLHWFLASFSGHDMRVERFFGLGAYLRQGTPVEIGTDVSPWGMGGWLTIDGETARFLGCPISDDEEKISKTLRGSATGQQTWECLAVLGAVDIWVEHRNQDRIILKVRGDKISALTSLIKMRPSMPAMGIIARELALRLVELPFPADATHAPGLSHVIVDKLSRVHEKGGTGIASGEVHEALAGADLTEVPARNGAWYKSYQCEPA